MIGIFIIIMIIVSLSGYMFANSFCYAFYRTGCTTINKLITTKAIRHIFSILSVYAGFKFKGDYQFVLELPPQYMILSNHQSIIDIPLFMRYLDGSRLRFMSKKELGNNVPLVSVMLKSGKHCLVDRNGQSISVIRTIDKFAENIKKENLIPVVFPEGTRSRDGKLRTFHAAGFRRLISQAPMPVAVCALDGGWNIASIKTIAQNLKGGAYKVKVLKIYPAPQTKDEQVHILEEGKKLIQKQLDEWREKN
ncbi:1-acyl-sn-glycerol-3-phosphate acyltransferase [Treponema phagedenis]|uniref:Acyltransferase n=1 Tax=Treponema phagedenis TaxID=162 RepID=A0A0B7GW17_TREPH|nr:lysophospholipid acyltransferase family protein [Treponema phagedenis]QSH99658.1 1-acyl-sn-glycerol-3-phosphate acyltransferase [Treponema phagedenis]CEM60851.1 Acyltransferase [Treponema phagedenis]